MDYQINGVLRCKRNFPLVLGSEMVYLLMVYTDEEIHRAIFSLALLKALEIDGFQASFYQSQ